MEDAARPTILVVDDDADVCQVVSEQLADRYGVACVYNGREAVQWLGRHRSGVDAVILDLQMPALSGLDVLEYLQWAGLGVPVILHTAHAAMARALQRQGLPVAGILVKPVQRAELLAQLDAALAPAR